MTTQKRKRPSIRIPVRCILPSSVMHDSGFLCGLPASFEVHPLMVPFFPVTRRPEDMGARRFDPVSGDPHIAMMSCIPRIIALHPDQILGFRRSDGLCAGRRRTCGNFCTDIQLRRGRHCKQQYCGGKDESPCCLLHTVYSHHCETGFSDAFFLNILTWAKKVNRIKGFPSCPGMLVSGNQVLYLSV